MSDLPEGSLAELRRLQSRVLTLYSVAAVLSLIAIFLLGGYAIRLGPLVGPGVESSFGIAVALMMLFGALVVHLVDRVYREWPLGRKFEPSWAVPVTDAMVATFLKVVIFAAAAGAVAYVLWGLVT
ncbi:MAG TPA: hypothetical protein VEY07_05385 [Thermoplasmata archaeon]|nr:hypothetical protein [Thermoplasmata archaeon]